MSPRETSIHGLRECGTRIDRLLEELHEVADPVAWKRIEALVTALVDLYGAGLEQALEHAHAVARSSGELDARLAEDELVSSLLLLHGLHPATIEERVGRALDRVRAELPAETKLELAEVEAGVVKLRVDPLGDSSAEATFARLAARAIERDAPEITSVHIEDTGGDEQS
jgi:hypothetical protein